MIKDEAMQQALEALLDLQSLDSQDVWLDRWSEAITSLREALEQQPAQEQQQARVDVITVNLMREGIDKHRARELADHFVNFTLTPPLLVQEPKKRCCDHDSDCSVHNGNALPVGPCDCSQTFISSPDLGIVVTVSYQLAVRELAKLVENNFGQMPRNDEWADKVLLVRDTFEAARNKGAKP